MTNKRREPPIYNISNMIRDTMEVLALTQAEFGKHVGITQQAISNWLSSERYPSPPKLKTIFRLAEEAELDKEDYLYTPEQKIIQPSYPRDVKDLALRLNGLCKKDRKHQLKIYEHSLEFILLKKPSKRVP